MNEKSGKKVVNKGGERKIMPQIEAVKINNCGFVGVDGGVAVAKTDTTETALTTEYSVALTRSPPPNDMKDSSGQVTLTQRSKLQVTGSSERGEDEFSCGLRNAAKGGDGDCLSMSTAKQITDRGSDGTETGNKKVNIASKGVKTTPASRSKGRLSGGESKVQPASSSPPTHREATEVDDHDSWQLVTSRKGKLGQANRPVPIRGCSVIQSTLSVAKRRSWHYISGLAPGTTEEQLKGYMEDQLKIGVYVCQRLKTRRDDMGSFKVEIDWDDKQKMMNPENWQKGISVNFFINLRRRPTTGQKKL